MSHIAINTLEYARKFKACGFPTNQAEGLANAMFEALQDHGSGFATKNDIEQLQRATKNDIKQLRAETHNGLEQLRAETQNGLEQLRLETKSDIKELRIEVISEMHKINHGTLLKLGSLISVFALISGAVQFLT